MPESERRRKYRYDRVLIETTRVLDPQFDDSVVYLTGAQIEMLRNMTQYLNRLDTYVTVYNVDNYLTPTVEEYDSILAIVADMEEVLMSNPNTIFGYKESLRTGADHTKSGDGDRTLYIGNVPAGELWRIETLRAVNEDSVCSRIEFMTSGGFGVNTVYREDSPAADEIVPWDGMLTLSEGMSIHCTFYDCLDGDSLWWEGMGYTMAVP